MTATDDKDEIEGVVDVSDLSKMLVSQLEGNIWNPFHLDDNDDDDYNIRETEDQHDNDDDNDDNNPDDQQKLL